MKNASFLTKKVIAHRGIHSNYPENSMMAFKKAIQKGYPIELDVQLTKDNEVIVFHDATLKRMCSINKRPGSFNVKELKQVCLDDTDQSIPTLKEVLKVVNGKVPIIVELKKTNKNYTLETNRCDCSYTLETNRCDCSYTLETNRCDCRYDLSTSGILTPVTPCTGDKYCYLSYKNNTKIGKATITIFGIGIYTGKRTANFEIIPSEVKKSKEASCGAFSLASGQRMATMRSSLSACGINLISGVPLSFQERSGRSEARIRATLPLSVKA